MSMRMITGLTFAEARQRRLVLAVSLMGIVFLVLFTVGFYFAHRNAQLGLLGQRPEFMNFFLMAGMYVVNFLVAMLTVLASVDTISGEIGSGTMQTLVTKPLRRWKVVVGKWIGLAAMLAVFVVVMTSAMVGIVWTIGRYVPPNVVQAVPLMVLEGLVLLTLSVLGGTRLSTLANGVVVFMLFGLAFIAGWIEQIGSLAGNETMVSIGIAVSLIIPSEAMWRRAAWLMQPPFLRQLGFGPFATSTAPSLLMVGYAMLYVTVALGLAVRSFQRRDL